MDNQFRKNNEIRIVGGTKQFEELLKEITGPENMLVRFDSPEAAVSTGNLECAAYIILPHYEAGAGNIPEMSFETIKKYAELQLKGQKLFIENYLAGDYLHSSVFGHLADARERYFYNEYLVTENELKAEIADGELLQARNSYYYPGRDMGCHTNYGSRILLYASDCIGTHKIHAEGSFKFPVMGKVNNFFYSAMNMTQFDRTAMLPVFRWKCLYAFLLHEILGIGKTRIEAAFEKLFKPVGIRGEGNSIENCVEKAVQWHFNSGLLPDNNGSRGMFEMIRSNNLGIRANIRMDSELMTGFLFCLYGKRKNDKRLIKTGNNLIRFLLDNGIQVEEGEAKGFFKWFYDLDSGPHTIWASDTSRAGLMMINMYKLFPEKKEYLERAGKIGDALVSWLGPEGLLCGCFNSPKGYKGMQSTKHINNNPVFYGEMTSFLLQLHKSTGNEKYKNAVLKYSEKIMEKFPDTKPFGFSDNFTYSRYLLMLLILQEMLQTDLSGKINECLGFFSSLQHPSGGIRETPIRLKNHAEAGVGIGDDSDNIADLLYCNNFVLCALSVAVQMHHPFSVDLDCASTMHQKLRDFILRIQIYDTDTRLNGGWMRAFDMDNNEYYGLNKDKDWGAYCIMAGWITGYIPLTLLNELDEKSIFIC